MIPTLFTLGVLACLGCGLNVVGSTASWKHEFAWVIGGLCGGAMIAGAIVLRKWGF